MSGSMWTVLRFFLTMLNSGLMLGLTTGVLLLLRPVLKRIFSPNQRILLWLVLMVGQEHFATHGRPAILPVTFQDLVVPRTGDLLDAAPAFLPGSYDSPGTYHLALPGDILVRIPLWDGLMIALLVLYFVGLTAFALLFLREQNRLLTIGRQGQMLDRRDPFWAEHGVEYDPFIEVWVSPGLSTSFARRSYFSVNNGEIYLQAELPPEQMRLVFLHESRHATLLHTWWKLLATFTLLVYWWNPLVWLGFRAFNQDLELACDASVMKQLAPGEQKKYAETLLLLASGEQIWNAPLYFGESDAELRIKALVEWKPWPWWRRLMAWAAAIALCLFFFGGHRMPYPNQDLLLAWEREGSGTAGFVQELEKAMTKKMSVEHFVAVEIREVWDAPDIELSGHMLSTLWVELESGSWYRVVTGWYGGDTKAFFVIRVEEIPAPDTTGWDRLA